MMTATPIAPTWYEHAFIGHMLAGESSFASRSNSLIRVEDFSDPQARALFAAAQLVLDRGYQLTPLSLLQGADDLGVDRPDMQTLDQWMRDGADMFTRESPQVVARTIREATGKLVVGKTIEALQEGLAGDVPLSSMQRLLQSASDDVAGRLATSGMVIDVANYMEGYLDRVDAREGQLAETAIPTPFPKLTSALSGGFRPGQMITLAARTGEGKSFFGAQCALAACLQGKAVFFMGLEMTRDEMVDRMVSSLSRTLLHHLRTGQLTPRERERVEEAVTLMKRFKLYLYTLEDTGDIRVTTELMRAKLGEATRMHGAPDMLVLDYIQLLEASERSRGEQETLVEVSRKIKQLAIQKNLPVITLAQINTRRGVDVDPNGEPELGEIRGSNKIAFDSDVVLTLFRVSEGEVNPSASQQDAPENVVVPEKEELTVIRVQKARNEVKGQRIYCRTRLNWSSFVELDQDDKFVPPESKLKQSLAMFDGIGLEEGETPAPAQVEGVETPGAWMYTAETAERVQEAMADVEPLSRDNRRLLAVETGLDLAWLRLDQPDQQSGEDDGPDDGWFDGPDWGDDDDGWLPSGPVDDPLAGMPVPGGDPFDVWDDGVDHLGAPSMCPQDCTPDGTQFSQATSLIAPAGTPVSPQLPFDPVARLRDSGLVQPGGVGDGMVYVLAEEMACAPEGVLGQVRGVSGFSGEPVVPAEQTLGDTNPTMLDTPGGIALDVVGEDNLFNEPTPPATNQTIDVPSEPAVEPSPPSGIDELLALTQVMGDYIPVLHDVIQSTVPRGDQFELDDIQVGNVFEVFRAECARQVKPLIAYPKPSKWPDEYIDFEGDAYALLVKRYGSFTPQFLQPEHDGIVAYRQAPYVTDIDDMTEAGEEIVQGDNQDERGEPGEEQPELPSIEPSPGEPIPWINPAAAVDMIAHLDMVTPIVSPEDQPVIHDQPPIPPTAAFEPVRDDQPVPPGEPGGLAHSGKPDGTEDPLAAYHATYTDPAWLAKRARQPGAAYTELLATIPATVFEPDATQPLVMDTPELPCERIPYKSDPTQAVPEEGIFFLGLDPYFLNGRMIVDERQRDPVTVPLVSGVHAVPFPTEWIASDDDANLDPIRGWDGVRPLTVAELGCLARGTATSGNHMGTQWRVLPPGCPAPPPRPDGIPATVPVKAEWLDDETVLQCNNTYMAFWGMPPAEQSLVRQRQSRLLRDQCAMALYDEETNAFQFEVDDDTWVTYDRDASSAHGFDVWLPSDLDPPGEPAFVDYADLPGQVTAVCSSVMYDLFQVRAARLKRRDDYAYSLWRRDVKADEIATKQWIERLKERP